MIKFSKMAIAFLLLFACLIPNAMADNEQRRILSNTFESHDNDSLGMVTAYSANVGGYNSTVPPEASTVNGEMGVQPHSGVGYYRVTGEDKSNSENSFIYFKLYTNLNISIHEGMRLSYWVYHYQHTQSKRMAIDLVFEDGSTLRDSGISDTRGQRIHPAFRNDPLNQWVQVEVDLTPQTGKIIKEVLVAYDDYEASETGYFRSYFDDLSIVTAQDLNAKIVANTIPDTMIPGSSQEVSVTVKNIGKKVWSEAAAVRLGAVDDSDPFAIGRHVIPNGGTVKYGDTVTFTFNMVAPAYEGVLVTDWRMVQDGVAWFGDMIKKEVKVAHVPKPIIANHNYTYNSANQLLDALHTDYRIEYAYDTNGNLLKKMKTSNLLPNASFEKGSYFWNFSPTMAVSGQLSHNGSHSIRFYSDSPVLGTSSDSYFIPVKPNTDYELQANIYNNLKQGSFYVDTYEFDNQNIGVYDGDAALVSQRGQWGQASVKIRTKPNTTKIIVRVVADSGAVGEAFADAISLVKT